MAFRTATSTELVSRASMFAAGSYAAHTTEPPKACPPTCTIHCEYGNVRDENGCPTCRCKPHPCAAMLCGPGETCAVVQPKDCKNPPCDPVGVCVPRKDPCPLPLCMNECKYGYQLNENGCQTCKCKPNPCALVRCKPGYSCEVQQPTCVTGPCDPIAVCKKDKKCPDVTCAIHCPHGRVKDANGCDTCICKPNPNPNPNPDPRNLCAALQCPQGTKCALEPMPCLVPPCPMRPVCRPLPTCLLPPKTGHCKAAFKRFYYDARDGKCKSFIYGGCGGNANNFKTLKECYGSCGNNPYAAGPLMQRP